MISHPVIPSGQSVPPVFGHGKKLESTIQNGRPLDVELFSSSIQPKQSLPPLVLTTGQ